MTKEHATSDETINGPDRRWIRFSLRSLLTVILLVALMIAWQSDRRRLSRQLQLATVRIEVIRDQKQITNGSCWPEVESGEGVTLDDVIFTKPADVPRR